MAYDYDYDYHAPPFVNLRNNTKEKDYSGVLLTKGTLLEEKSTGRLLYYQDTDRASEDLEQYYHLLTTERHFCYTGIKVLRYTTEHLIKEFVVYDNGKCIEKEHVKPVPEKIDRFKPGIGDQYAVINQDGSVFTSFWYACTRQDALKDNFNLFEKASQAEKVSALLRVPRAVAMACVLVDPDYKPDWGDTTAQKFRVFYTYGTERWTISVSCNYIQPHPYVSTREKAEQVCALLTEWGVKP